MGGFSNICKPSSAMFIKFGGGGREQGQARRATRSQVLEGEARSHEGVGGGEREGVEGY